MEVFYFHPFILSITLLGVFIAVTNFAIQFLLDPDIRGIALKIGPFAEFKAYSYVLIGLLGFHFITLILYIAKRYLSVWEYIDFEFCEKTLVSIGMLNILVSLILLVFVLFKIRKQSISFSTLALRLFVAKALKDSMTSYSVDETSPITYGQRVSNATQTIYDLYVSIRSSESRVLLILSLFHSFESYKEVTIDVFNSISSLVKFDLRFSHDGFQLVFYNDALNFLVRSTELLRRLHPDEQESKIRSKQSMYVELFYSIPISILRALPVDSKEKYMALWVQLCNIFIDASLATINEIVKIDDYETANLFHNYVNTSRLSDVDQSILLSLELAKEKCRIQAPSTFLDPKRVPVEFQDDLKRVCESNGLKYLVNCLYFE